jgi:hypothetical protein
MVTDEWGGSRTSHARECRLAIIGLGLLASISPSTLVVFIMVLATVRARANATALLIG